MAAAAGAAATDSTNSLSTPLSFTLRRTSELCALETLDCFVVRQAEPIVGLGQTAALLFSLLPRLTQAGCDCGLPALAFVLEDGLGFLRQFPRTQGHGHVDLGCIPR